MFNDLLKGIMLWTQGWDWLLAEVDWENYGKKEAWTNQALEKGVVRIWNERGLKILYSFNNSSLVEHQFGERNTISTLYLSKVSTEFSAVAEQIQSTRRRCQGLLHVRVRGLSLCFLSFSLSSFHFVGVSEF